MIESTIKALVAYGLEKGFYTAADCVYVTNRLLEVMQLDDYAEPTTCAEGDLETLLNTLTDDAVARGLCEDSVVYRDLFDTRLMGAMLPMPGTVIDRFNRLYREKGAKAAADDYYAFSCNTNYIRVNRVQKDRKWTIDTAYGTLDITINLSKPEKDPKAIAASLNAPQTAYPKCQLCKENEGYAGRVNHPARQNHRIIPITLCDTPYFFQYSPYVYYNEHCIVFNNEHTPMVIDRATFAKLLAFVAFLPHYFIGSNADLPIVGGSILSHDHFQGGHYTFAMAKAPVETPWQFPGFEDISAGIVTWPLSVLRLRGAEADRLVDLADRILQAWRGYTDESVCIYAQTEGTPHNTITPIARQRDGQFELDLVLRNNLTTKEHPMGLYHPHAELHHIKKEGIGLIEVMGLAVLPARLKNELAALADALVNGGDLRANPLTALHADWAESFRRKYDKITAENVQQIIETEVGLVFTTVLEHAGVFKRDEKGKAAFLRFLASVS